MKASYIGGFIMYFILESIFLVIGVVSIYMGINNYGFWSKTVPGGGFMPVLMGVLIILITLLTMIDKKTRLKLVVDLKGFVPVLAIFGVLLVNIVVGLIPAATVMIFSWLKFVEKYNIKKSLLVTVITSVITYAIFGIWLNVPFPTGLLDIRF